MCLNLCNIFCLPLWRSSLSITEAADKVPADATKKNGTSSSCRLVVTPAFFGNQHPVLVTTSRTKVFQKFNPEINKPQSPYHI